MGRKKRFKCFALRVETQETSYSPYGQSKVKARICIPVTATYRCRYLDDLPCTSPDPKRRYHLTCCDIEPAVLGKSPTLRACTLEAMRTDIVKLGM